LKEKAKAAPKQLIRRGLDDGTERLRGQLRETAQRGQASDYGGDRIEDAAARGAYQVRRGVEALLKKKKSGKSRLQEKKPHTESDPPTPESPADLPPLPESPAEWPSPHEPPPREQPRIKTREAVSARESGAGAGPSESSRAKPSPEERMRQTRIKTRESAVHDPHPDVPSVRQAGSETPQVRIREPAVCDFPMDVKPVPRGRSEPLKIKTRDVVPDTHLAHGAAEPSSNSQKPPDRLSIKTKDAYIQRQPAEAPDQPPQAFTQEQQGFVKEQGRRAAVKRAEAQRLGNSSVPQVKGGRDVAPSVPAQRGHASSGRGYAPAHHLRQSVSSGNPDTRPVQKSGKTIVKTARSTRKVPERTARHAIKTAERSSRKTIKATQRTAKTATRTAKTAGQTVKTAQRSAQATVKATQRAVQTARATAKAAATTAKAAAKATVAAVKAAIAAMQELIAAIAAGGWVVLVVVLVICMIGLLIASPFGIFFSDGGGSPDAVSPTAAMAQINQEYADTLSGYQTSGSYDSVEIVGRPPSWADVFAVFAAKTAGAADGESVAVLDTDTVEKLRTVFWDMTKITTETKTVDHPASDDTDAWTETVLTITVTPRTPNDMRVFYSFTDQQNAALDELLTAANRELWNNLLYGSSGEIVAVALSQVGNVGGQPYWSWYGFNSRVEWCACFVSWCANECGYIDAGVMPKFAGCTGGSNWFKARGQWQDGSYEPRPGDLIFFDWDNKGSSGPQDDVPDHVGIVERVENGVVYTVEGNSSDSCRQRSYNVGHYEIWGYGCPIYN